MRVSMPGPASLPAATAWLAPLPPGIIWKPPPRTVSPGAGRRSTETTKSMFRLPTTTMRADMLAAASAPKVDTELLQLFGVIAAQQQIPLLGALGDFLLLGADLGAGGAVHLFLHRQDFSHILDDGETDFIGVLLEAKLAGLAERGHQLVRNVVDLVARQLHVIAGIAARGADHLALRDQRVLDAAEHLLIADALAAHVVAVLVQQIANLVIEAVLNVQLFLDDVGDEIRGRLWIG